MDDVPMGVWSHVAGSPTAPLLVLVHGSMDRSAGLLRLGRRLDADHCVVRYDRRGYGRSLHVGPPWNVEENVADLIELVETTGQGPATVFGHSFGGNVALGLGSSRPDLVERVIVYETPLSWLDSWPQNSAGAAAMAASDASSAAEAFMRRLVGDAVWERLPAAKQDDRRAEGPTMVAELADLRRGAPWIADRVTAPVLALCGELARPHHRSGTEQLAQMLVNGTSMVIPGAGHAGPHTHADLVAERVIAFSAVGAATAGD